MIRNHIQKSRANRTRPYLGIKASQKKNSYPQTRPKRLNAIRITLHGFASFAADLPSGVSVPVHPVPPHPERRRPPAGRPLLTSPGSIHLPLKPIASRRRLFVCSTPASHLLSAPLLFARSTAPPCSLPALSTLFTPPAALSQADRQPARSLDLPPSPGTTSTGPPPAAAGLPFAAQPCAAHL